MAELQQAQASVNTVFEMFAHQRRRYILHSLRGFENPMALADLADEVAVRENETHTTDIPTEEVKPIYFSLYHTHIPKVADEQFVHYDQEQDEVSLSERVEQIEQYQELLTID